MKPSFTNLIFFVLFICLVLYCISLTGGKNYRENMENIPAEPPSSLEDSFCQFHSSDKSAVNQEKACGKLTQGNCLNTKCCVWGKMADAAEEKCFAGINTGPVFKTDNSGNSLNVDYYYYMNKCYGNCPAV